MAKKPSNKKKTTKNSASTSSKATRVTRITASDTPAKKRTTKAASKKQIKKLSKATKPAIKNITKPKRKLPAVIAVPVDYFKGAWQELRMVRWPNRAETWRMTIALIVFTLIFTAIILLLDALFKFGFEAIIK